jgi:hypothetical protein
MLEWSVKKLLQGVGKLLLFAAAVAAAWASSEMHAQAAQHARHLAPTEAYNSSTAMQQQRPTL